MQTGFLCFPGCAGPLAAALRPQNGRPRGAGQRSLGDAGWVKRASAFAAARTAQLLAAGQHLGLPWGAAGAMDGGGGRHANDALRWRRRARALSLPPGKFQPSEGGRASWPI